MKPPPGSRHRLARIVTGTLVLASAWLAVGAVSPPAHAPRPFPDTSSRIAILTDQLPARMTAAQQRFAATHYIGSQKLTLELSRPLRALNPDFLVLHYHLAMWQSAPNVKFIVSGNGWGNDYPLVTTHETWFWHNPMGQRVASSHDGKLLMNISDAGFVEYWQTSIAKQVAAGDYDGVFLDSASPALLQGEARKPMDPRLSNTGVKTNRYPEFGGRSWISAWQTWIMQLQASLSRQHIPLIPNVGAFTTTWDTTDYSLSAGAFSEGFCDPSFPLGDWKDAVNRTLALITNGKIVILQNYLASDADLAKRRYLLANYLLMKGDRTYLSYFASSPLSWYPEWNLQLGAAQKTAQRIDDLWWNGIYRRDFANGIVLVNPTPKTVAVDFGVALRRVEPQGGGTVPPEGVQPGHITTSRVTRLEVRAKSAEILMR